MITLQRPTDDAIRNMLRSVSNESFTYDAVGCLNGATPSGFNRDSAAMVVGNGSAAWEAAKEGIRTWEMFPKSMVSLVHLSDGITTGTVVAVLCQAIGIWTINPARILSTTDLKEGSRYRFGFTYGTLPGHVESGEELFCVEWDEQNDQVTYRLDAMSRPQHWLCRLGYPYTRYMQARFRELSCKAVRDFVEARTR